MSFLDYVLHGWKLCAIPQGSKGPISQGWQLRANAISTPEQLVGVLGVGILHSYSQSCALDVDNLAVARPWLLERGIDIDALLKAPDSVQISSGRANRAKLLYRLPTPLVSKKLCRYEDLFEGKTYHALELRCATRSGASVQDCLPGTLHPGTGRPYEWKYGCDLIGDWRDLPPLPEALLKLWQAEGAEVAEDPVIEEAASGTMPEGVSLKELAHYIEAIDPGPYDDWVAVGMAIHHETSGSPEGLALWDTWSRKSEKYGEEKDGQPAQLPADKWRSFTMSPHDRTIGTLKKMAGDAGRPTYVELDDFPVVLETAPEPAAPLPILGDEFAPSGMPEGPGEDTRPGAQVRKALAPLVFVASQGTYFDRTRGVLLNRDAIDDLYTPLMPTIAVEVKKPNKNGGTDVQSKWVTPKPREELRKAAWKEVVDSIGMHPGAGAFFTEGGRRYLNTFLPTRIEPLVPTADELEAFEFMWSRPGEQVFRDWLKQFFAHAVQKPGVKIRSAPLIVGHVTGSGKSTLMKKLPELLFTPKYVTTMTSEGLREQFNDQLARSWWVHFEEMHSGNARAERASVFNKIKPWITEGTISVRPMYGSRYDAPNRVQFTGASNYEDDALNVDEQDRRWAVGHIAQKMSQQEAADLYGFLESDRAPGVLRHIFQNVSLTGFNPNAPAPDTKAKRVMVRVNYGVWESEILELVANGTPPFDKDMVNANDLIQYVKGGGITVARLGRILNRSPFNGKALVGPNGKRIWAWRNVELWEAMSQPARSQYMTDGVRPHGHNWSDQLPPELAEACGFEEPASCDLI